MIAKIQAFLSRPFMQVFMLLLLGGAAGGSMKELIGEYRDGLDGSVWVVALHVIVIVTFYLFARQAECIEKQLKALQDVRAGYEQWKAQREQG